MNTELWKAKKIVDSTYIRVRKLEFERGSFCTDCCFSDTGEPVFLPFECMLRVIESGGHSWYAYTCLG